MRESRLARMVWGAVLTVVYAFVFGPLVLVALVSFSADSYLSFPPSGWSLRWYRALVENAKFTTAAGVSLTIAATVSALSLALAAGDKRVALRAHLFLTGDHWEQGDRVGAEAHGRAYEALDQASQHSRFQWVPLGFRGAKDTPA